jgi:hypothetical protein
MKIDWKSFGCVFLIALAILASIKIATELRGNMVADFIILFVAMLFPLLIYFYRNRSNAVEAAGIALMLGIPVVAIYSLFINPSFLTCGVIWLSATKFTRVMCDSGFMAYPLLASFAISLIEGVLVNFLIGKHRDGKPKPA